MIINFRPEMWNPRLIHAVACLQLEAFKFYPLDKEAREKYFFKRYLRFLKKIGQEKNKEAYLDYILGDEKTFNFKAIHKDGYVAGSILIHLLAMKQQGHKPVLETAKYMFKEWNIKQDKASLSLYKTKTSFRSLETSWRNYKSVAHLWAIDILIYEKEITSNTKINLELIPFDHRDSRVYLSHVKAMEKKIAELDFKNFDFIQLPDFPIGLVVEEIETQWSADVQNIFSKYTHISSKKTKS